MDALVEDEVMPVLRDRWGVDLGTTNLRRGVAVVQDGSRQLVVRVTSAAVAAVMLTLLRRCDGLRGAIPTPVADREGAGVYPVSDGAVIVTTYLPGRQPLHADAAVAREISRVLASVHACTADLAPEWPRSGRDLGTHGWAEAIAGWHCRDSDMAFLKHRSLALHPALDEAYRDLPRALGHGDVHLGNVALAAGRVRVFDFGGCFSGSRLLDLCNALANLAGASGSIDTALARAVLAGYSDVAELTQAEAKLLPLVMALDLVRVIAWLEESGAARLGTSRARAELGWRTRLALSMFRELDEEGLACSAETTAGWLVEANR